MNIYMLISGNLRCFVAAESEEDAYAQGTDPEKHPDLHFRPFEIVPVQLEGYTITVTVNVDEPEESTAGEPEDGALDNVPPDEPEAVATTVRKRGGK